MAPSSADVPNKFDCIINGQGYLFAPSDTGLPPSVFGVKNEFSFSPTFIPRQNVSGDYGDNQQDFWQTFTQRDWSLGEQLKYARPNDQDASGRYWRGTNVDVSIPGQVSIRPDMPSLSMAGAVSCCGPRGSANNYNVLALSSTNLYEIAQDGTITDKGAHGLGATPTRYSITTDVVDVYFSGGSGSVGVRKWDGTSFSTFSASPAGNALEFLNNTLYGLNGAQFIRYDTAGTATTIFTWKQADGGSRDGRPGNMRAFGGKLLILWGDGPDGAELWIYDGTAPSLVATLPANFYATQVEVLLGSVFISGSLLEKRTLSGTDYFLTRPAIFYYINGNLGLLWQADQFASLGVTALADVPLYYHPSLCTLSGGLVFNDDTTGKLMMYNPAAGGVHSVGSYSVAASSLGTLAASSTHLVQTRNTTTAYRFPALTTASTATITTALTDFDSSLTKLFRGIKVEFVAGSDGNGGSVDIAYRVGDVDGSYTTLQTGATSGTEYALSNITGRAISVKVTLNKGTSTDGPILKRIAVRGLPIEPVYKQFQYVLSLAGVSKKEPFEGSMGQLRDGTVNPLTGDQQAANLVTAITSSTPISCYDAVNGTMSSVFLDQANCKISQVKPGEYIAVIVGREV